MYAIIATGGKQYRVSEGDVIYIEANSGVIKRVGRSDAYSLSFTLSPTDTPPSTTWRRTSTCRSRRARCSRRRR